MQFYNLALLALAAFPALSHQTKVHGVVIYSRHGDRELKLSSFIPLLTLVSGTSKVIKGYQMTRLGAEQLYNSGSFYRERYIENNATYKIDGISSDEYKPSQFWASGPDQSVRAVSLPKEPN